MRSSCQKKETGARECNSYGQWQFKGMQIHEVHAQVSRCRVRARGAQQTDRDTNEGREKTPISVIHCSDSTSGLSILTIGYG